jgi:hypothetical protein
MFERFVCNNDDGNAQLPISGSEYTVNISGTIKNRSGYTIPESVDSNGDRAVYIDWIKGNRCYQLAFLVAISFKPIRVPVGLWHKLTVLFKDGNRLNIHPSNLIWKYPVGGLESNSHPGYYFIPGHSRYVLNKDGHVLRHLDNWEAAVSLTKSYYCASILPDIGNWTRLGIHRGIALVFLDYQASVDADEVNHINGVKVDNSIGNLEWITGKGNINSAFDTGLFSTNKPVLAMHVESGYEVKFRGISECSRVLGIDELKLSKILYSKSSIPVIGYIFKFSNDEDYSKRKSFINTSVLLKDNESSKVMVFESKIKCAEFLQISIMALNRRLSPDQPLFDGKFQVKLESDISPWRELNTDEVQFGVPDYSVLIRNSLTREISEYPNMTKCAEALGISKDTVYWRVNKPGGLIFKDGNQYKLKSDLEPWNDKSARVSTGTLKPILLTDTDTGKITTYQSQRVCATDLNVPESLISKHIKASNSSLIKGRYIVTRAL